MKQYFVYFGLFSCFVAALAGARYMDSYSKQYQLCADKWKTSAELAKEQPVLASRLLVMIHSDEMQVGGEACPPLRLEHAEFMRKKLQPLTVRSEQLQLRGLSAS